MYKDYAMRLFENGYQPIPIKPGYKRPAHKGWQNEAGESSVLGHINSGRGGWGVGVNNINAIDVDVYSAEMANLIEAYIQNLKPKFLKRVGQAPKFLIPIHPDSGLQKKIKSTWSAPDGKEHAVELLHKHNQQFVAYAIHPDTGQPYQWFYGQPWDIPSRDLDIWTAEELAGLLTYFDSLCESAGFTRASKSTPASDRLWKHVPEWVKNLPGNHSTNDMAMPRGPISLSRLSELVYLLPMRYCDRHDDWFKVGGIIYDATGGSEEGRVLFNEWSRRSALYNKNPENTCDKKWAEDYTTKEGNASVGTLIYWLSNAGIDIPPEPASKPQPVVSAETSSVLEWVQVAEEVDVLNSWIGKVRGFTATATEQIMKAIHDRFDVRRYALRADLKAQQLIWRQERRAAARERKSADGITTVKYDINGLGRAAEQAAVALSSNDSDDCVYRFGSHLVSVVNKIPVDMHDMQEWHDTSTIKPYNIQHHERAFSLIPELEKVAIFTRWSATEHDYVQVQWDDKVVNALIKTPSSKDKILTGVIEYPYCNEKFEVIKRDGYDPLTGLVHRYDYATDLNLDCTAEGVSAAYKFLRDEALADFPFEEEIDAAAAVAMFLNILQLHIIKDGGNPGFIINAPNQADGKTTLAQHISCCITGKREVSVLPWHNSEEEQAKVILAALIQQRKMLLYDNVPEGQQLESNVIAATMTSKIFSGRILGISEIKDAPMNALLVLTGNNIKPMKDFNTRMLTINLNSKMENPGGRKFSRDSLSDWREQYREDVIKACLTIIKAPVARLNGTTPRSRFKDWTKYVQVPVYQASGYDIGQLFTKNIQAERAEEGWGGCLKDLRDHFGSACFISSDLVDLLYTKFKNLEEEIAEMTRKRQDERVTKFDIPKYFNKKVNKIYDGLTLKKGIGTSRTSKNRTIWWIEQIKQ